MTANEQRQVLAAPTATTITACQAHSPQIAEAAVPGRHRLPSGASCRPSTTAGTATAGAICGNLPGTHLGARAIDTGLLTGLEGRDVIEQIADDLHHASQAADARQAFLRSGDAVADSGNDRPILAGNGFTKPHAHDGAAGAPTGTVTTLLMIGGVGRS